MQIERSRSFHRTGVLIMAAAMTAAVSLAEDSSEVVDYSQRPATAPVLTAYVKDGNWYRTALTGIEPPYPASLGFLEDQGAWYTPFNHPGLTGPYDIRHWHVPILDGERRSVSGR